MRLPRLPAHAGKTHEFPLWPPLLATRGAGSRSAPHSHHAMHFVLGLDGELRTRASSRAPWTPAAGVLTAPDVVHEIDASGIEILLVFLDPESDAGATLSALLDGPIRLISDAERAVLIRDANP